MKPRGFDYVAPTTLAEALDAFTSGGDDVRLLAGGQTLVPVMNFRLATPDLLVDLNRIPELSGIAVREDGALRIGAMTRHRMVEMSDCVRAHQPLLHRAMPFIAHVQIRNRGTIGGSLAHCDPAAEWPALCMALDAQMVATGLDGTRTIPADEFSLGILTTALKPGEILTDIIFPKQPAGRRVALKEVARRHGDFALAGIACTVDFDDAGAVSASRIVAFGVDDRAVLLPDVSAAIQGRVLSDTLLREAGALAATMVMPRDDFHASEIYRRELVDVLVRRALGEVAAKPARMEAA